MSAFTRFFNFLLLHLPRHLLNEQLSWRLRCTQRIRAVNLKGTCAIILARPVSRTASGGARRRGALPLIQPKLRPRVIAFVSLPLRPQPRAAWAGTFPDAPRPWSPLAAPSPVGDLPHRAPQRPQAVPPHRPFNFAERRKSRGISS